MNKFNLKTGQILGDYRVVSVGEEGAFFINPEGKHYHMYEKVIWYPNDEIQTKFNLPKEKWVPKEGEDYFYLTSGAEIESTTYRSQSTSDGLRIKINNCFQTEAEALSKAEEIKKVLLK